jgi:hypothetical protein
MEKMQLIGKAKFFVKPLLAGALAAYLFYALMVLASALLVTARIDAKLQIYSRTDKGPQAAVEFWNSAYRDLLMLESLQPSLCGIVYPDIRTIASRASTGSWEHVHEGLRLKSVCKTVFVDTYATLIYTMRHTKAGNIPVIPEYVPELSAKLGVWAQNRAMLIIVPTFVLALVGIFIRSAKRIRRNYKINGRFVPNLA